MNSAPSLENNNKQAQSTRSINGNQFQNEVIGQLQWACGKITDLTYKQQHSVDLVLNGRIVRTEKVDFAIFRRDRLIAIVSAKVSARERYKQDEPTALLTNTPVAFVFARENEKDSQDTTIRVENRIRSKTVLQFVGSTRIRGFRERLLSWLGNLT